MIEENASLHAMKLTDEECSVIYTLEILGKKWNPFIVVELLQHPRMTFTELRKTLAGNYTADISARVLTDKLQVLERCGIVKRIDEGDGHVYYSLTSKGEALEFVLIALKTWGIQFGGAQFDKCKNKSCIHSSLPFDSSFTTEK